MSFSDADTMRPSTPRDKIVLLGARGVGKNSLRQHYSDGAFGPVKKEFRHVPCHKVVTLGGRTGMVEMESIRYLNESGRYSINNNLKYTDAFLIVYSVTSRVSFEAAIESYAWIQWLHWSSSAGRPGQSQVPVVLVGNKNDLEGWREVSIGDGRRAARELGIGFFELSARDTAGVKKLFHEAIHASRLRKDGFSQIGTNYPHSAATESLVSIASTVKAPVSYKKASIRSSRSRLSRLTLWRRSVSCAGQEFVPAWDPNTDYGKNELQEGLVAAAKANDAKKFKSFAQAGAQLDGRSRGEKGSVVHIAAAAGHLQVLEIIIDREAGINLPDLDGIPPLQLAAVNGHYECVSLLLQNGADIDQTSPRYGTALSAASSRGHTDIVRLLLYMGAEVEVQGSSFGNMMQRLSRSFDTSIVQFLQELDDDDATTTYSSEEGSSQEASSRDVSEVTTPNDSVVQLTKIDEVEDIVEGDSVHPGCVDESDESDETVRYSQDSLMDVQIPSDSFEVQFSSQNWIVTKVAERVHSLNITSNAPIQTH